MEKIMLKFIQFHFHDWQSILIIDCHFLNKKISLEKGRIRTFVLLSIIYWTFWSLKWYFPAHLHLKYLDAQMSFDKIQNVNILLFNHLKCETLQLSKPWRYSKLNIFGLALGSCDGYFNCYINPMIHRENNQQINR